VPFRERTEARAIISFSLSLSLSLFNNRDDTFSPSRLTQRNVNRRLDFSAFAQADNDAARVHARARPLFERPEYTEQIVPSLARRDLEGRQDKRGGFSALSSRENGKEES